MHNIFIEPLFAYKSVDRQIDVQHSKGVCNARVYGRLMIRTLYGFFYEVRSFQRLGILYIVFTIASINSDF